MKGNRLFSFSNREEEYSLKADPSLGLVPKELPPFKSPCFVIAAGKGSNAMLQAIPPGISNAESVSFNATNILLINGAETPYVPV
jgi:hypothetical protein